ADDLVAARTLVDGAAETDGEAAARLGVLQRRGQRRALGKRNGGLEAVAAVVADEDGDARVGRPGLEVADEQLVALALVLGDLHRLAEPRLAVRVVPVGGLTSALELVLVRERPAAAQDEGERDRAEDDAEREEQLDGHDRGGLQLDDAAGVEGALVVAVRAD